MAQQQEIEGGESEWKKSRKEMTSSSQSVRSRIPSSSSAPRPREASISRVEWPLFESPSISRMQVTGFEVNNDSVVSGSEHLGEEEEEEELCVCVCVCV